MEAELVDSDGETFSYSFDDQAPDVQIGDVIAGSNDPIAYDGYLRKVLGVDVAGDVMNLVTEQASLLNAIEQCNFAKTFELAMSGMGSLGSKRLSFSGRTDNRAELPTVSPSSMELASTGIPPAISTVISGAVFRTVAGSRLVSPMKSATKRLPGYS